MTAGLCCDVHHQVPLVVDQEKGGECRAIAMTGKARALGEWRV
jgi:hypothetical protein